MFKAIPLFAIPLIVYNLMMLSGGIQPALAGELFAFDLMSGAHWTFSVHDAFIAAGVLATLVDFGTYFLLLYTVFVRVTIPVLSGRLTIDRTYDPNAPLLLEGAPQPLEIPR